MTGYELLYCLSEKFMPVHYVKVRRLLKELCEDGDDFRVLDIGGRKSPYTINVNCNIDIVDLPRKSEIQKDLNLGLNEDLLKQIKVRRSNIKSIRLEDITKTELPSNTYDAIVSVEVIEHVPDDSEFVKQMFRLLKPGGTAILTTPNGEGKTVANPDHIREYSGAEFGAKLSEYFNKVEVFYGEKRGYLHRMSLKGWAVFKLKRIWQSPWIMLCAFLANFIEKNKTQCGENMNRLFAVVTKK